MKATALYFSVVWCGPCKPFKPIAMEALDNAGIAVIELDADTALDATMENNVRSLPTIVLKHGEEEIARVVGASQKQLKEAIEIARRSDG